MTSKVPQGDIGIADTWLNPPPHQRKFLGKEARVPYSRKMRRLVVCYEPLHPLFIHFEFDHSIVRFNLEPPVWPYEFGGRDQYLVVAAASQDRSGKVTFHFDHGHQSPLLDQDAWESIHRSPAWVYLQPKIMEWHDLRESRRVDRISKQDILRSLCPPNDISNPTIEHEILQELKKRQPTSRS